MHDRPLLRHTISLQTAWEAAAGRPGWTRRFGRPLDLPPGERLVLVIAPAAAALRATLNGIPLADLPTALSLGAAGDHAAANPGGAEALARDVTEGVAARNELVLVADDAATAEPATGGPGRHRRLPEGVARVWLEVHAAWGDGAGAADHP